MGFPASTVPTWGERLKSIFISQNFVTKYELLCSEASIQALRARIWSQWVENDSNEESANPLLTHHDIKPTVTQAIQSISKLLLELKAIEARYKSEPSSRQPAFEHDVKRSRSAKVIRTLSLIKPSSSRQRSRASGKQRSLIGLARWAVFDCRKFGEKVRRVKGLVDGLEDILRAAGAVSQLEVCRRYSNSPGTEENPPPYSSIEPQPPQSSAEPEIGLSRSRQSGISRLSDNSIFDMLEHHAGMKEYLTGFPVEGDHTMSRHRESLIVKLTTQQFKELRMDVYEELLRRQELEDGTPQWLPDIGTYHAKRNEARRKLSTITPTRFSHLLFDIVSELERRFPHLKEPTSPSSPSPSASASKPADSFPPVRSAQSCRWGCVRPHDVAYPPPPFLQYRPAHHTTVCTRPNHQPPLKVHVTPAREGYLTTPSIALRSSQSSQETFKSLRVSMEDRTSKILLAALKKYNIQASWEQYSLYIIFGNYERKIGLEEKPLIIFTVLDREGKKPMFMVRKLQDEVSGGDDVPSQVI